MSRWTAPLAVAATLCAGAFAAIPFSACTDGTTPDCSGDGGMCGYSLPEPGPGDGMPVQDSAPVEAATPQDSAPPDSAPPEDSAPPGDSAPADAPSD